MFDFQKHQTKIEAAKIALRVVGKMSPGKFRAKKTRDILINLNILRGKYRTIEQTESKFRKEFSKILLADISQQSRFERLAKLYNLKHKTMLLWYGVSSTGMIK